jgi:type IV pilus assembly protein PilE
MQKFNQGFTLIELMIVTLIVAILVAIAVPSYNDYVIRANRSHAQAAVLRAAQWMERVATVQGSYQTQLQPGLEAVEGGAYTVCLVDGQLAAGVGPLPQPGCPGPDTPELTAAGVKDAVSVADPPPPQAAGTVFTLVAYPNSSGSHTNNANDKCGDFAVDSTGTRGLINYDKNMKNPITVCWGK